MSTNIAEPDHKSTILGQVGNLNRLAGRQIVFPIVLTFNHEKYDYANIGLTVKKPTS